MIEIELVDPDEDTYSQWSSRFTNYNSSNSTWNWKSYSCIVRSGNRMVAGGRGITNMGALEVRGLWVDEHLRGQGIGEKILTAIENEARDRGASRAMLYTYTWQAENFYRRMGYIEFSRFTYPDGPERIDMKKELQAR